MKRIVLIGILLMAFLSNTIAQEMPFSFKWDNGFKLESVDKKFKLKFGGRVMVDHAFFSQDADLDQLFGVLATTSATEIRRARIFFAGTVYSNVAFKLDLGFEGGAVALKDMYIGIKDIPVIGNLRIGHVKEPFRLEMLTSSKYITFSERSFNSDFSPIRNSGILMFNDFLNKRVSAQAGLFRNVNVRTANDVIANDGYTFTGRVTGLAINDESKKQLLHIGLGYSFRKPSTNEYKVSSKPEVHLSTQKYINTGTIEDVTHVKLVNFEMAFVRGPLFLQAEYITSNVNRGNTNTIDRYSFYGYFGQVSYFLTGEHKKYKSSYSGFDRVRPTSNFGGTENKGLGAWEIAIRYSNSNLNSGDVLGGNQTDITLGLNWYLNPATKVSFNKVWANIEDKGNANAFQMRFQVDF